MTIKELEKELLTEVAHCDEVIENNNFNLLYKKEKKIIRKYAKYLLYLINPNKYKKD